MTSPAADRAAQRDAIALVAAVRSGVPPEVTVRLTIEAVDVHGENVVAALAGLVATMMRQVPDADAVLSRLGFELAEEPD